MKANLVQMLFGLVTVLILACIGCSDGERYQPTFSDLDTEFFPPVESESAARSVVIDGHAIELRCHVWRDFMPDAGENPDSIQSGTGVRASLKVIALDSFNIQSNLDLNYVWLFQGDSTFATALPLESEPVDSFAIKKIVTGGPMWEVGSVADVMVRLVNAEYEPFYIRVYSNVIVRTD